MGRYRARNAPSPDGRELHGHLAMATRGVRQALAVCGRAARRQASPDASFRQQQRRLGKALGLLESIGHLQGASSVDLAVEARHMVAWLESRERAAGTLRSHWRGTDYQRRLQQVLALLNGMTLPDDDDEPSPFIPAVEHVETMVGGN